MPEFILVDIGVFQPYILDTIKQLQLFDHRVTVLTDIDLVDYFSSTENIHLVTTDKLDIGEFMIKNKMDTTFRGGFWTHCSKRIFYVYAYMKQFNKQQCFHIENDVMVYHTLESSIPELDKVWMTMDSPKRCIPGIVYIPSYTYLDRLIENYDYTKNDMENMAQFFNANEDICRPFPIILQNKDYKEFNIYSGYGKLYNGIFDAAAIGQYLGGIDPQNQEGDTRGFINETCVVDYSKYTFHWIKNIKGLYIPHIRIEDTDYPIFNLHIHCKRLSDFMSTGPNETKYSSLNMIRTRFHSFESDVFDTFFKKQETKTDDTTLCNLKGELIPGYICTPGEGFYTHINYYSMKRALQLLVERNPEKTHFTFVETGCAAHGTKSTLLWDKFVNHYNGSVYSVDLNPNAVNETRALTSSKTTVVCSDSLKFLPSLTEPIDFLYLDSYDANFTDIKEGKLSALHHLKEFNCIKHLLHKNSIILIDDTPISPYWLDNGTCNGSYEIINKNYVENGAIIGKGNYVNIELESLGAEKILHQYQTLWVM